MDVPVKTTVGETVKGPAGAGLFTASVAAVEVPPPGVAFTAVSDRVPVLARSAAVSVTFTCVALTKSVVRALPFTSITVVGTKPVPLTATSEEVDVVVSTFGASWEIVGAGLFTCRVTAAPEPLLALPFSASTESWSPLASCDADTAAVT